MLLGRLFFLWSSFFFVVVFRTLTVGALFPFATSASVTGTIVSVTFGAGLHALASALAMVVCLGDERGREAERSRGKCDHGQVGQFLCQFFGHKFNFLPPQHTLASKVL